MRRLIVRVMAGITLAGGLTACAGMPSSRTHDLLPVLQLSPADLTQPLALQQQLEFRFSNQQRQMMALLESDGQSVRLAVQAMGQTGVRLSWDGARLEQKRAAWLPSQVRAERVLDDLQFVFWPAGSIAAALPSDWELTVKDEGRALRRQVRTWLESRMLPDGARLLRNHADGYELTIHSIPLNSSEEQ